MAGELLESHTENGGPLPGESYTEIPERQVENSKDFLSPGSLLYTAIQSYFPKLSLFILLSIDGKTLEFQ